MLFFFSATGGSRITLTGTRLGSNPSDVTVVVGGVSCDVTSSTDTTIECTLGAREGGPAAIEVNAVLHFISSLLAYVEA